MKETIFSPLMAGIMIGIAGAAFLGASLTVVGSFGGAVLFAFGLLAVVNWKLDLFTGKAGFWSGKKILRLIPVLLLNIAGCSFVALISMKDATITQCLDIVNKRMAANWGVLFLNSCMCGLIMTTAVQFSKKGNFLPLLFGVPTFIMAGFPHCIADVYYWIVAMVEGIGLIDILPVYIVTVFGNFVGCNMPRLIPGFVERDIRKKSETIVDLKAPSPKI